MEPRKLANSPLTYFVSRAAGQAEWVLFIHAAFVNHQMFQTQFAYFQHTYNILAVDVIGHGQSLHTQKGDTIERMSPWIYAILQAEKIDKIHMAGVSLGAVLAQDFAHHYPHAVSSLACFGGYDICRFDPKMNRANSAKQAQMMLKALFSVKWFAKANREISAYTPKAQNEFYAMNLRFPKKSFRYLATLHRLVNRHKPGPRDYPLLIGCGAFDVPMELEAVRAWKNSEPDCTLAIFANAGHCVNMDVPQAFNRTLEAFWKAAGR